LPPYITTPDATQIPLWVGEHLDWQMGCPLYPESTSTGASAFSKATVRPA
jgi:hypothetical protein